MSFDVRSIPAGIQTLVQLLRDHSDSEYGGEVVTQGEHALQSALLAEQSRAPAELITAALLHDIGHLLHHLPDDAPDRGIDDHHEVIAARRLQKLFGPEVVAPVRMHVAAKRYLCAVEPGYWESLSEPSQASLILQGGPMSPEEAHAFRDHPQSDAAVSVRRWDDLAKTVGLPTPTLDHFVPYIVTAAQSTTGANV
jgi:phosphonate degradation associated HDIG domain protein